MNIRVLFLVLLCCVLLTSCAANVSQEAPAPDFVLKDVFTGKDLAFSAYKGRPVILYFFASW